MNRQRHIYLFVAFLSAITCLVHAQNRVERAQLDAVAFEVRQMAAFFDVDPEVQEAIIEECQPMISAEAERLIQIESKLVDDAATIQLQVQRNIFRYQSNALSEKMLEDVRAKVVRQLPHEMQLQLDAYRADCDKMRAQRLQLEQWAFVQTMDNALSFSDDQKETILKLIKGRWKEHWNTGSLGLTEISAMDVPSSFFVVNERSLLSVDQAEFLDEYKLPVTISEYDKISRMARGQNGSWSEIVFRDLCLAMLKLKRANLVTMELSQEQIKMLDLGERIAAGRVTESWKSVIDSNGNPSGQSIIQLMQRPILTQCLQQPEWRKAARKVFGESSLNNVDLQRQKKVEFAARRVRMSTLTSFFSRKSAVVVTFEQFKRLEDLVVDRVPAPVDGKVNVVNFYSIFTLTDEDFQQVLKPFQWELAKDMIRLNRSRYDQVVQAFADE